MAENEKAPTAATVRGLIMKTKNNTRIKDLKGQVKEIPFPTVYNHLFKTNVAQGKAAKCPHPEGHKNGDRNPSFSVGLKYGRCHVGCKTSDGAETWDGLALWMFVRNVDFKEAVQQMAREILGFSFPVKQSNRIYLKTASTWTDLVLKYGRPDYRFNYVKGNELLLQVGRWDANPSKGITYKEIRQRQRIDGGGDWRYRLEDHRRCLYRCNKLDRAESVYFVEGETCVHALEQIGCVATTTAGGSNAFDSQLRDNPDLLDPLKVKAVYVLPDNDAPGAKYAESACAALQGVAKTTKLVKLPDIPDGGDIVDFIKIHGPEEATAKLIELAEMAPVFKPSPDHVPEPNQAKRENPSSFQLLRLIYEKSGAEHFKDQHGDSWVRIERDGHFENLSLKSSDFHGILMTLHVEEHNKGFSHETFNQLCCWIAAKKAEQRELHTRFAYKNDAILIDSGRHDWSVFHVTAHGWSLEHPSVPIFKRSPDILALPDPVKGAKGAWAVLDFIPSLKNRIDQILAVLWMIVACVGNIPRPLFLAVGQPGSCKTSACIRIKEAIDPTNPKTISMDTGSPKECYQHLVCQAVPILDNLRRLPRSFSDFLCRVVTGDGFKKRKLYSDSEAVTYSIKQAVMVNGIECPAAESDLLDRSLIINFDRLDEEEYKDEMEIISAYEREKPQILYGVLDALSGALAIKDLLKIERSPRMADFYRWFVAVGKALKIPDADLEAATKRLLSNQNEQLLQNNMLAQVLKQFAQREATWKGTGTELSRELNKIAEDFDFYKNKFWPKNVIDLARKITPIIHNLSQDGILITRKHSGDRTYTITCEPKVTLNYLSICPEPTNNNLPAVETTYRCMDGSDHDLPEKDSSVQPTLSVHDLPNTKLAMDQSDLSIGHLDGFHGDIREMMEEQSTVCPDHECSFFYTDYCGINGDSWIEIGRCPLYSVKDC